MRPAAAWLGRLTDLANPLVVRMVGANINRRTVDNVRRAGLAVESVRDLGVGSLFKLIVATDPREPPHTAVPDATRGGPGRPAG